MRNALFIILIGLSLFGCKREVVVRDDGGVVLHYRKDPYKEPSGFAVRNLAKSDTDMVSELHLNATLSDLRTLMIKLYKRNPYELYKTGASDPERRAADIFNDYEFAELVGLGGARDIEAIQLAFDPEFIGDRVLALVGGMADMIMASYNHQHEFYVIDSLDPQKLYDAARNIEIAVWRLSNTYDEDGHLFLLSNSGIDDDVANLSYERLFGKLIGRQDMIARIVADKSDRTIKSVVQTLASALFIPIP
ncbi:MAG: hypothetical protein H6981_14415 [Gammaproteobacteria bacterium]|nr:hypothetical protein [Gammaproteobacteria bacterium]MCP5137977.1 hypothetical protein [Gammaproteobacteria bacterium]